MMRLPRLIRASSRVEFIVGIELLAIAAQMTQQFLRLLMSPHKAGQLMGDIRAAPTDFNGTAQHYAASRSSTC